jgi:chromosome partitioning protein
VTTTFTFANHKGGCGKTTSVANTSAALAARGLRVLAIDADPQANLSEAFGVGADLDGPRLEHALADAHEPLPAWTVELSGPAAAHGGTLQLVPCSAALEQTVTEHLTDSRFADRLADKLDDCADGYDAIVLDTPPGLAPLASMAMLAADWVIVPARPADFDVGGAVKLAALIRDELCVVNPRLQLLGVLLTQVDRRWTLTADTRQALADADIQRLRTEIPFMVRTGAAPRQGAPIVLLEPDCRLATAYHDVARDLAQLLKSEAGR